MFALRKNVRMTPKRFTPSAAVARRDNLLVAAIAGLGITAVTWSEGFEEWTSIALAGVATAVLSFGVYALLCRLAGWATLEFDEAALAIEHKGQRIRLPWPEVTHVRFGALVLDYMLIGRRDGRPMRVSMEGHDQAARAEMLALIRARAGQRR